MRVGYDCTNDIYIYTPEVSSTVCSIYLSPRTPCWTPPSPLPGFLPSLPTLLFFRCYPPCYVRVAQGCLRLNLARPVHPFLVFGFLLLLSDRPLVLGYIYRTYLYIFIVSTSCRRHVYSSLPIVSPPCFDHTPVIGEVNRPTVC